MLTTRPTKRDKTNRFGRDLLFDVLDNDKPIGNVVFGSKTLTVTITLDGKIYTVAHDSTRDDDRLY